MKNYLLNSGLEICEQLSANNIVESVLKSGYPPLTIDKARSLYSYDIPEETVLGVCSTESSKEYHLYKILGVSRDEIIENHHTLRLLRVNEIVCRLQLLTAVDWLGIYRKTKNEKGREVLLKEAYYGKASRAEFPLEEAFAKRSNNSSVGLSGKAILVQDIDNYRGPYFTCDIQVKSELCLPILGVRNEVIGIIDAESFRSNFFTDSCVFEIAKVARDLAEWY